MIDVTIGDLPKADSINDEDLIEVESQQGSMKVTVAQIKEESRAAGEKTLRAEEDIQPLPNVGERANKIMGFDDQGNPIAVEGNDSGVSEEVVDQKIGQGVSQGIDSHNNDAEAHPGLREFITSEADRAEAAVELVDQKVADGITDGVSSATAVVEAITVRAEAARDAAFVNADVKTNIEAGLTGPEAVEVGQQFQVLSADGMEYRRYRKDSETVAVEVGDGSPTPKSIQKPVWAGKTSGWPDPFFRYMEVGEPFDGKQRWRGAALNGPISSWYLEDTPAFGGRDLVKVAGSGNSELSGPMIYLSELGAKPGDVITIRALVVGDGAVVAFPGRPQRMDHTSADIQKNASPATITATSTPQLITLSFATTHDTEYVRIYPFTTTAGKGFRIRALWAYFGAPEDGPSWPIVDSEQYLAGKAHEAIETSGQNQILVQGLQPKIEYAVSSTQAVRSDSEVAALAVTNPQIGNLHTLPFRGWGEIYSPAGVSFNAVRAVLIGRAETPEAGRWSRINVIVKTGSDANSGSVVAVGSISSRPNSDILQDVTILLQSPTTGDFITLSDADLGGQYFIGMYAENASGQPAGMGQILATQPNSLGQSYYLTTADPSSAWMATAGTNRIGFEHLLLTNPRIETVYSASDALKADVGESPSQPITLEPLNWIPPKVYVTQGIEGSIYLDSLIADDAEDYAWSVSGTSQGQLQHERWTINPTGAVSATSMKIRIHDKRSGSLLTELAVALVGSAANAGSGITRRVQLIGDSFANAGHMTQALLDNATGDVMGIELIGTRGAGMNRHEGRGGWRIDDYATAGRTYYQFNVSGVVTEPAINSTRYSNNGATFTVQEVALTGGVGTIVCSVTGGTPSASGTLAKTSGAGDASIAFSTSSPVSGNPFWVGGKLDYSAYLLNNSLPTPETVFIELGVNDVFGQTSDSGAIARAAEQFVYLDQLISSIKAAGVAKIALIPASGPSGSQDAFGASYGTSASRWRVKRNFILWNQSLVEKYHNQESVGIYISPAGLNWDVLNNVSRATEAPVNSRSTEIVRRMNNGVHPAVSGYQQIGDAMWAFLKCTS